MFWDVPVAVGVRPVRIWALALCAGRPPGCPAEASGVAGLRATVVVPPFRIPDERPEAVEEVVGVRAAVVVPFRTERPEGCLGTGRAVPVAPSRTLPGERPAAVEPDVVVCVRAAVVTPFRMPDERAEVVVGVRAAPAARKTDGRETGVCTGRAVRAAW